MAKGDIHIERNFDEGRLEITVEHETYAMKTQPPAPEDCCPCCSEPIGYTVTLSDLIYNGPDKPLAEIEPPPFLR